MLAGVLTVLKILGIVILCVLVILILLLLLILFVPVRYKLDGDIPRMSLDEGFDAEKIHANVSFSWLLHIISGGISYPENKQFEVRFFGIKVYPFKEKKKDTDKKSEATAPASGVIEMSNMDESKAEAVEEKTDIAKENTDASSEENTDNKDDSIDASKEENSFLDVLWNIIDNVSNILKTPQNVFEKMQYTISRVCGKISMIKTTIENDIFKRAFKLVKRKLIRIIKMMLPDKSDTYICLGTGDPAQTAEIVGAYSIVYPVLYKKVRYEPDFEEKVIELDTHLKGHITIFVLVYSAAVCFFNKDVKKVIRRFKKILN